MKGPRTDWEDGNGGTPNGLGRRQWRGTERTGKTAMKGDRTDWEDGNEGAQNGLGNTAMKEYRKD